MKARLAYRKRARVAIAQRWSLDVVGPIQHDSQDRFLLVAVEALSRYAKVWPLPAVPASAVVAALSEICAEFGPPAEIVSDNGANFEAGEVAAFCASKRIKHHLTVPYHPEANGQVERLNRTLLDAIKRSLVGSGAAWPDVARRAVERYNGARHTVTLEAPARVIKRQLPPSRLAAAIHRAQDGQRAASRFVPGASGTESLPEGSWVLRRAQNTTKLQPRWIGPFRVVRKGDYDTYDLDVGHSSPAKCARDQLCPITDMQLYLHMQHVLVRGGAVPPGL